VIIKESTLVGGIDDYGCDGLHTSGNDYDG